MLYNTIYRNNQIFALIVLKLCKLIAEKTNIIVLNNKFFFKKNL